MERAVNDFYNDYPETHITFVVVQTNNLESYEEFNVRNLENNHFYLRKEPGSIWEIEGIEEKIRIDVGELP